MRLNIYLYNLITYEIGLQYKRIFYASVLIQYLNILKFYQPNGLRVILTPIYQPTPSNFFMIYIEKSFHLHNWG